MKEKPQPIEVKRVKQPASKQGAADVGSGMDITWSDGLQCTLSSENLRRSCPCAECREENKHTGTAAKAAKPSSSLLKVISSSEDQQLNLLQISPIGNYALGIQWGDGHNAGIFTYSHLRELCLPGGGDGQD